MKAKNPVCEICDLRFNTWRAVRSHRAALHANVNFTEAHKCNICYRNYSTRTMFNSHILKEHRNPLRCNLCCYITTKASKADMKAHLAQHETGKITCYPCYSTAAQRETSAEDDNAEIIKDATTPLAADATMSTPLMRGARKAVSADRTTNTSVAANKIPTADVSPDEQDEGGVVQVDLPFTALDACRELTLGQTLQLNCTSSTLTKAGFVNKQDVSLFAQRKTESLSLLLKAENMGSILKGMLGEIWQCDVTSYHKCDPISTKHTRDNDKNTSVPVFEELIKGDNTEMESQVELAGKANIGTAACDENAGIASDGEAVSEELGDHSDNPGVSFPLKVEESSSPQETHSKADVDNIDQVSVPVDGSDTFNLEQEMIDACDVDTMLSLTAVQSDDDVDHIEQDDYFCQPAALGEESTHPNENKLNKTSSKRKSIDAVASSYTRQLTRKRRRVRKIDLSDTDWKRECQVRRKRQERRSHLFNIIKSTKDTPSTDDISPPNTEIKHEKKPKPHHKPVWVGNRIEREEVLKLNTAAVMELVAMGDKQMMKLPGGDVEKQLICLLCMKSLRKKRWYHFCHHLQEIHFITPLDYKAMLALPTWPERQVQIEQYQLKQRDMKKRYKEMKYKVKVEDMMQCPACSTVVTTLAALSAHIMSVHINDDIHSELVQYVEGIKEKQKCQKSKKMPDIPVKCDYCGDEKISYQGIKMHMRMAHIREPDMKDKLERAREYVRDETLRIRRILYHANRKSEKTELLCRYCGDKFSFRSSRGRHEKFSCNKNPNRLVTFSCQYCDHRFISKEELNEHRQRHQEEDFKYICDICGMVRRTKAGMYDHKKNKHNTAPPKHKCLYCDKRFHNKDRLHTHMTIHSDKRAFQCEICGSSFKTRSSVQKHQNAMHFNKYTYYCDKCGHGMSKLSYLEAHKCGRIRRTQDEQELVIAEKTRKKGRAGKATFPIPAITWAPEPLSVEDTEISTLPKVELPDGLVYHSDSFDKQRSMMETEIATHILMGSNLQASHTTTTSEISTPTMITMPTASMPTIIPYSIDQASHIIDVVSGHSVTGHSVAGHSVAGHSVTTEYSTEYVTPHEVLIDYTRASQLLQSRSPIEVQYMNSALNG